MRLTNLYFQWNNLSDNVSVLVHSVISFWLSIISHFADSLLHFSSNTVLCSMWLRNLSVWHNITDIFSKLHTPLMSQQCVITEKTGMTICLRVSACTSLTIWKESQRSGSMFNDMFRNRLQQVQHTMQPSWFSLRTPQSTHVGKMPFKSCSNRKVGFTCILCRYLETTSSSVK